MVKFILFFLVSLAIFFSCKITGDYKRKKYYIIIERTSKSLISNMDEREDKKDSVLATSDENAYDSCMATLYGIRYADSVANDILRTELEKLGRMSEYGLRKQTLGWKVIGYKILNDEGVEIQDNISDSVKTVIQSRWDFNTNKER